MLPDHSSRRLQFHQLLSLVFFLIHTCGLAGQSDGDRAVHEGDPWRQITLRGKVICIAEHFGEVLGASVPFDHQHLRGFLVRDTGKIYTLLHTRNSIALFLDERLWKKELLLTGRLFEHSMVFEATHVKSIKEDQIFELFYYCEICAITTLSPELCACCQQPVVLTEELIPKAATD